MKLLLSTFFIVFLSMQVKAQFDPNWGYISKSTADSLKKSLLTEKNDTLLMAANRSLGFYYQENKLDSALYYHTKQIELAEKLDLKMWLADAYSQVGYLLNFKGNAINAYDYFKQAEALAKDEKNEKSNWHYWVFSNARNLREARLSILAMNFNGIGSLLGNMGDMEKRNEAMEEMRRIGEKINNGKILANYYGNIAFQHATDSSIQYIRKAIQYSKAANYNINLVNDLNNLSKRFFSKNMVDSALHYAYLSAAAGEEQKNLRLLDGTYYTLALFHGTITENYDSALFYAKKILSTAETTQVPSDFANAYFALAKVYDVKNNTDSALRYEQLYSALSDSLNQDRISQLSNFQKSAFAAQLQLKKINDEKTAYQNKITLYSILAVLAVMAIVALLLFRNNRQKQKSNLVLKSTLSDLKSTQAQLIQAEKMASLGELTAGIAHEIQNPLNFVNNFSEVSNELIEEVEEERAKSQESRDEGLVTEILADIRENLSKINHHGKRADAIVKGMLEHSRANKGEKAPTDLNALADEFVRLSYHGLRAKDKSFNADFKLELDPDLPKVNVVASDIGRVILNLVNNAFYVVHEKAKSTPQPPQGGEAYKPEVTVKTTVAKSPSGDLGVKISVLDNGSGIPDHIKEKIFQPFFTTKPTGSGTGLGLSLSYDIVKAHGGELKVVTQQKGGSEFIIQLPIK